MQISLDQLSQAGVATLLQPAQPLDQIIYRLYRQPLARGAVQRRVVVLRDPTLQSALEAQGRQPAAILHAEDAAQLLQEVLLVTGGRAGVVVYDCQPGPADYVLTCLPQGYGAVPPVGQTLKLAA